MSVYRDHESGVPEPPDVEERMAWSAYVIDLQREEMRRDKTLEPSVARSIVYARAKAAVYQKFPFTHHARLIGPDPEY